MDKFCGNCGNKLAEEETFCGQCGAKVEEAPAVDEAPAEKKASAVDVNAMADKVMGAVGGVVEKAKTNPLYIGIAAGAVVVVIVLIILANVLFGGGGEKKAIANYIDVTLKGNYKKVESLAPAEYWDYLEDEEDIDLDDMKDQMEESREYIEEMYEEAYGDNVKISWKITDKEKLSKKELDTIADGLKENYDIPKKKVTAAYEMEVELKIKGSDDEDEDEATIYVAKIGGKWYPVSSSGSLLIG